LARSPDLEGFVPLAGSPVSVDWVALARSIFLDGSTRMARLEPPVD
jgi:hypothetical protein